MEHFNRIIILLITSSLLCACGSKTESSGSTQSISQINSQNSVSSEQSSSSILNSVSFNSVISSEQNLSSIEESTSSSISSSNDDTSEVVSSVTPSLSSIEDVSSETSQFSSVIEESSVPSSEAHSSDSSFSSDSEEETSSSISEIISSSESESSIVSSETSSGSEMCENHVFEESTVKEATIIEKGIKRKTCVNCGEYIDEYFYDLNEFEFSDTTYMYDGHERELLIDGMIPYGTVVKYENNKLTDIGSQVATAKIYDENNNLLISKTATISIIENVGLPNIRINTSTGEDPNYKEKTEYTPMTSFIVDNCEDKYQINKSNAGGLRVRGNSTNQASVTKRAWRIKFDKKSNLLGLNNGLKAKSWVLMADFFDSSMFRNATAWGIGNDLFNYNGNYCSDRKHVNLYMNGDYRGVYLLAEQQKAESNFARIPIIEAEENYTGTDIGYLLEIDGLIQQGNSDEEYTFTTGSGSSSGWGGWGGFPGMGGGNSENSVNGVNITDKYYAVKTDCYSNDQLEFIKKYTTNVLKIFKQTCKGEKLQILDENNELIDSPYTTQYETLNAVMDIDSFFRMYVLQEFAKNFDVGWGSFYLYVDFSPVGRVRRLTLGAPWDFDLGSGNKQSGNGIKTNDDYLNGNYANSMTEFNPWLYLLSQTDFFQEMFKKYYSCFANSSIYEQMMDYIEYETSAFSKEFADTYTRWDLPNATNSGMNTRRYNTHQEAVTYLTDWYKARKEYLDSKYL